MEQLDNFQAHPHTVEEYNKTLEKPQTLSEYKQLMRVYFTKRNNVVVVCGHKLDPNDQPANNCPYCWFAFFNSHGDLVNTTDEFFKTNGKNALEALQGKKYVKNFLKFMSTLNQLQGENEQSSGSIIVSGSSGTN